VRRWVTIIVSDLIYVQYCWNSQDPEFKEGRNKHKIVRPVLENHYQYFRGSAVRFGINDQILGEYAGWKWKQWESVTIEANNQVN